MERPFFSRRASADVKTSLLQTQLLAQPDLDLFSVEPRPWIFSSTYRTGADQSPSEATFTRGLLRVRAAPHRRVLEAAPRWIAGAPKDLVEAPFPSSQALSAGRTPPQMSAPKISAAKKVRATQRLHPTTVSVRTDRKPYCPQRLAQAADIGVFSSNINFQEERTSTC